MSDFNGFQSGADGARQFEAISFLIRNMLSKLNTATLVKVMAVTNSGGVSAVGFVDIMPMVNMLDGKGNAVAHKTIYRCPYLRIQGGSNAVILDPQVGDIGIAVFADRDISSATANKAPSNPGSFRQFDAADGMYLGGVLNGVPSQYVQFAAAGITIHSPSAVVLSAPDVQINCTTLEIAATTSATITTPTLTVNGNVTSTGTVTAPNVVGTTDVNFGGKSGIAHVHSGVQTGTGHTGAPV